MKVDHLVVKNFNLDHRIPYLVINQERKSERTKSKTARNFAFIKNQHLSRDKYIETTERPKTSFQSYQFPKRRNKRVQQQQGNISNLSVRLENKCMIDLKDNLVNSPYKPHNYFPQRKTKRLDSSRWYKYCVDSAASSVAKTQDHHTTIRSRERMRIDQFASRQTKKQHRMPYGRSMYLPSNMKKPNTTPIKMKRDKVLEISPWMISKDQQIAGF